MFDAKPKLCIIDRDQFKAHTLQFGIHHFCNGDKRRLFVEFITLEVFIDIVLSAKIEIFECFFCDLLGLYDGGFIFCIAIEIISYAYKIIHLTLIRGKFDQSA